MQLIGRVLRRSYAILEIEGTILVALALIIALGLGAAYTFTNLFGNQESSFTHVIIDDE